MGLYTKHWEAYRKRTLRGTLHALLVFALGILAIAALGYFLEPLDTARTVLLVVAIGFWLVVLVTLALRQSRVVCPRCSAQYSRGTTLVNCPKCDLRMLQEDP